jgi:hypothetical protein
VKNIFLAGIILSWCYSPALISTGEIRFNVWESSNLVNWQCVTNTAETSVQLPTEPGVHFFRVQAVK